jgi:hypothetical protein
VSFVIEAVIQNLETCLSPEKRHSRKVAPAIRYTLNLFPLGVAAIDVGFQYASRKSLPQGGNDKPGRQTHMDR